MSSQEEQLYTTSPTVIKPFSLQGRSSHDIDVDHVVDEQEWASFVETSSRDGHRTSGIIKDDRMEGKGVTGAGEHRIQLEVENLDDFWTEEDEDAPVPTIYSLLSIIPGSVGKMIEGKLIGGGEPRGGGKSGNIIAEASGVRSAGQNIMSTPRDIESQLLKWREKEERSIVSPSRDIESQLSQWREKDETDCMVPSREAKNPLSRRMEKDEPSPFGDVKNMNNINSQILQWRQESTTAPSTNTHSRSHTDSFDMMTSPTSTSRKGGGSTTHNHSRSHTDSFDAASTTVMSSPSSTAAQSPHISKISHFSKQSHMFSSGVKRFNSSGMSSPTPSSVVASEGDGDDDEGFGDLEFPEDGRELKRCDAVHVGLREEKGADMGQAPGVIERYRDEEEGHDFLDGEEGENGGIRADAGIEVPENFEWKYGAAKMDVLPTTKQQTQSYMSPSESPTPLPMEQMPNHVNTTTNITPSPPLSATMTPAPILPLTVTATLDQLPSSPSPTNTEESRPAVKLQVRPPSPPKPAGLRAAGVVVPRHKIDAGSEDTNSANRPPRTISTSSSSSTPSSTSGQQTKMRSQPRSSGPRAAAATTKKIIVMAKPAKATDFGDGSELDGIEDLPEAATDFLPSPTTKTGAGYGAGMITRSQIGGKTATVADAGIMDAEMVDTAIVATPLLQRQGVKGDISDAASAAVACPVGTGVGAFKKNAAVARRGSGVQQQQQQSQQQKQQQPPQRQKQLQHQQPQPQSRPARPVGRTSDVGSIGVVSASRQMGARHQTVPPKKPQRPKKKPTLIRNLNPADIMKVVGKMRYDPVNHRWEGNEEDALDFEPKSAFGRSISSSSSSNTNTNNSTRSSAPQPPPSSHSPSSAHARRVKPGLITNKGMSNKVAHIVGNMVFDPVRMCWSGNEEEDPFADISDDEDCRASVKSKVYKELELSTTLRQALHISEAAHKLFIGKWYPRSVPRGMLRDLYDIRSISIRV